MIDVKQAVASAEQSLQDLYADRTLSDIALEEVELSDDERYWLITLGFADLSRDTTSVVNPFGSRRRIYKSFKVDAATGKVLAMKIREV